MNIDMREPLRSRVRRLTRIAAAAWIGSVVVAGTTDIVYQRYGGPVWVSSVVVHLFQGLALLAMGAFVLGVIYAPPASFRPGRVLRIVGLVFGAMTLLLGIWGLVGAAANLLALMG